MPRPLHEQLVTNLVNSPFSEPNADRSENVGLKMVLAYVSELRQPGFSQSATIEAKLFKDLLILDAGGYTAERRDQLLRYYESYFSRIFIFEEVIRAEAVVRLFAKSITASIPHITPGRHLTNLTNEAGNLLQCVIEFLDFFAAAEEASASSATKINVTALRRLIATVSDDFVEPIVNFRNRIAHGYSRSFHTDLRRTGRSLSSDDLATEIFNEADLLLATCISGNLNRLALVFNHLPMWFKKYGTFSSPELLAEANLIQRVPSLLRPCWGSELDSKVQTLPNLALRKFIEAPDLAIKTFWQAVSTEMP